MPPGGDGFYSFSVYFLVEDAEFGYFDIRINGVRQCTAATDQVQTNSDDGQAACSAVVYASAGS